jgi:hypothetical protein
VGNVHQNPEVIDRATTAHDSSPTPTAGRLALVDSPAGPESDRSQPGTSVSRFRKFTMRTSPKWTVTRHPGANDKTIPAQYRRALAKRVPCAVTAGIPGAGHYVDHPVRS